MFQQLARERQEELGVTSNTLSSLARVFPDPKPVEECVEQWLLDRYYGRDNVGKVHPLEADIVLARAGRMLSEGIAKGAQPPLLQDLHAFLDRVRELHREQAQSGMPPSPYAVYRRPRPGEVTDTAPLAVFVPSRNEIRIRLDWFRAPPVNSARVNALQALLGSQVCFRPERSHYALEARHLAAGKLHGRLFEVSFSQSGLIMFIRLKNDSGRDFTAELYNLKPIAEVQRKEELQKLWAGIKEALNISANREAHPFAPQAAPTEPKPASARTLLAMEAIPLKVAHPKAAVRTRTTNTPLKQAFPDQQRPKPHLVLVKSDTKPPEEQPKRKGFFAAILDLI